ncbi:MAG TPA: hypothetical protein VHA30_02255 [Patescibacteria group bacterium]|nr:hypothetical protein [Patescibacteria group bacterium]
MANASGKTQLIKVKNFFRHFAKNLGWFFFAAFLALLALEVWEVIQSVQIVWQSTKQPVVITSQQGTRVDFNGYQKVLQRIQGAAGFTAASSTLPSPFGTGK